MDGNFAVTEWTGQGAVVVRAQTSGAQLPDLLGETYGRMMGYLGGLGMEPSGAPFVAYHNMDMSNMDVEIGLPVAQPVDGAGDIAYVTLPSGKVAVAMHKGPYDMLRATYDAMSAWMHEESLQPTGVAYEMYISDPGDTAPEALLTQVAFPLVG